MNLKQEKWLMVATFAIVALLTLLPFFKIGFATDDDLQYFVTSHRSWQQWVEDARWYAVCSGRFYFLITKYFYDVPCLIDSFVYKKAEQYISLMVCYGVFSYLIFRIFRSARLATITLFYQAEGTLHSLNCQSDDVQNSLCHVVISCDGIKPNSITVSNMILPSVEQ